MKTNTNDILCILKEASDRWNGVILDNGAVPINEVTLELKKRFEEGYFGDFYRTMYIVEGSDGFPYDMLRYTSSFPADEQSSFLMQSHNKDRRRVKLCQYHRDEKPNLANDRWLAKFHWRVVEVVDTITL